MLETFYSDLASVCFTLLGLWWVVVQFKFEAWMHHPARRRMAYDISLYFLLPGIMSLSSLLAADATVLWRLGFGIAGVLGAVETVALLRSPEESASWSPWVRAGHWVAVALYVLIAVVAVQPALVRTLGLDLSPRTVEGILVTLLVFLGAQFVWEMFARTFDAPKGDG